MREKSGIDFPIRPFRLQAEQLGLRRLGDAVALVGPYLSTACFVMRAWAAAHTEDLVRYLQAYVLGLRWALDPANRAAAIALLGRHLRLTPDIAAASYAMAADPATGIAKDGSLDIAGFANVLRIRAEVEGQWGGVAPSPERYLDLSYYARALSSL